jgi:hypothetical protein
MHEAPLGDGRATTILFCDHHWAGHWEVWEGLLAHL